MVNIALKQTAAIKVANKLFKVLEDGSATEYFGENISQLEHCLQAAQFALLSNSDDETIIGALLHDIGQFLSFDERHTMYSEEMGDGVKVGVKSHDKLGEVYLRNLGFSEKVCILVGSHVEAKRYLTGKDKSYHDKLSQASQASLKCQGGPYTGEQVIEFEKGAYAKEIVNMRLWDDQAKIENYSTMPLQFYQQMIVYHLIKSPTFKIE
ncbi:hypothetical protein K502DRAFT_315802 [Neoconidiobolus thromboides FSU 785]|nr:hypothetical protein K502DRAFT_315802 [Neoconidiobolus thromboides FSU 785]